MEPLIRFCPPLIIEHEDIDTGIDILDHSFKTVRGAS
jgi:4-aminobutyrate aminotransferase-like enzyme